MYIKYMRYYPLFVYVQQLKIHTHLADPRHEATESTAPNCPLFLKRGEEDPY